MHAPVCMHIVGISRNAGSQTWLQWHMHAGTSGIGHRAWPGSLLSCSGSSSFALALLCFTCGRLGNHTHSDIPVQKPHIHAWLVMGKCVCLDMGVWPQRARLSPHEQHHRQPSLRWHCHPPHACTCVLVHMRAYESIEAGWAYIHIM